MGLLRRCFSTLCKLLVIHHIFWSFEIFLVIFKTPNQSQICSISRRFRFDSAGILSFLETFKHNESKDFVDALMRKRCFY